MTYAKLINNNLVHWAGYERIDGQDIITNNPSFLGWKEVVYTQPEHRDGYYPVHDRWVETETTIEQVWRYEQIMEDENVDIQT